MITNQEKPLQTVTMQKFLLIWIKQYSQWDTDLRERGERQGEESKISHFTIFTLNLLIRTLVLIHRQMFYVFYCHLSPVEGHHTACDSHVHGDLGGHSADHKHLLPSVWVKSWIIDVFCPPQLIFCQARWHNALSGDRLRNKTTAKSTTVRKCCKLL